MKPSLSACLSPPRVPSRQVYPDPSQRSPGAAVGREHKLAHQLWESDIYDAKVIGLLIDDPNHLSREQVERLQGRMLAHVFATHDVDDQLERNRTNDSEQPTPCAP